jgi:hypothetical protein
MRRRPGWNEALRDLRRIEATIAIAPTSARESYHRLRPLLREIAADRLELRHRISLDGDRLEAAATLGTEAWAMLGPDAQRPPGGPSPGPSLERCEEVVSRLEGI